MFPTLLSSCASAATAAEAAYRIDGLDRIPRATRVVALDEGAARITSGLHGASGPGTRFLQYRAERAPDADRDLADLELESSEGSTRLSDELADADFLMMVATVDDGAQAATTIGSACTLRGIMTAGLVLGGAAAAVTALRPHARVLVVTDDSDDVAALLGAVSS
jgi:hypothetical protein